MKRRTAVYACWLMILGPALEAVEPLDIWQWRNPLPQGNRLYAITYGGGRLVAVGDYGAVITSPDLAASPWAVSHPPTNGDLRAVAYGNGLYVAGGAGGGTSGMILTSPDGIEWTRQSWTNANTRSILALAYGAGVFVAACERAEIWSSPDGIDWSQRVAGGSSSTSANGVAYHPDFGFVAVGNAGKLMTSSNGIDWVDQLAPTTLNLNAITYGTNSLGQGMFLMGGNSGLIMTSPDGTNWVEQFSGMPVAVKSVACGPGVGFVAVGSGSSVSWVASSPDGVSWTPGIPSVGNEDLRGVAYGAGRFVAVGHYGGTESSETGEPTTWINHTPGWGQYNNAGVWTGTNFVVVSTEGMIRTSPDGIHWTLRDRPAERSLRCLACGAGLVVAGGDGGTIVTSDNQGANWALQVSYIDTTINGIGYAAGTFVAMGAAGVILTSPDGTNWLAQYSGVNTTLRSVAHNGTTFVAVGDSGVVLTSPDTINWTPQTVGDTRALNSVAYAEGLFVAVGERNRIFSSPDGAIWTPRTTAGGSSSPTFNSVTYGSGTFLVAGGSAAILTSPDGIDWVSRPNINSISQRFAAYGDEVFLIGGSGGILIQASAVPPRVRFESTADGLTLTWRGGGTLQAAPEASGTYANVPGAESPFVVDPLTESRQFYQVRLP